MVEGMPLGDVSREAFSYPTFVRPRRCRGESAPMAQQNADDGARRCRSRRRATPPRPHALASRVGFSRGLIFSRDGTLVASVAQEGLIRPREDLA